MKLKWLESAALTSVLAVPAFSQVGIYIGRNPPPPLRYEAQPPIPGPGYVWIDGYWGWRDGRYIWFPGRWNRPPYEGGYWVHSHWDHYPEGWRLHEGHWDREDHGDHHDWGHRDDRDHDRH
jgi:hypothetical protein